MPFRDYISYWKEYIQGNYSSPRGCLYLKDWHLCRDSSAEDVFTLPIYFSSDWLNEFWDALDLDDYRFVYAGPKGTWSPFHADIFRSFSWSVNICGRKKWLFFPPGQEEALRDCHGGLPYDVTSPTLLDSRLHPMRQHGSLPLEVMQEAGEMVFVPSGWHHQVHNLDDTISINHNWVNGCNLANMWHFLQQELHAVQEEVSQWRDSMPEWHHHCQVIMRSCSGINFEEFYHFLKVIAEKRLFILGCGETRGDMDAGLGPEQAAFDVGRIAEVLASVIEHPDFQRVDTSAFSPQPEELLRQLEESELIKLGQGAEPWMVEEPSNQSHPGQDTSSQKIEDLMEMVKKLQKVGSLEPRVEVLINRINEVQQAKKKASEELGESRTVWEALQKELDSLHGEKVRLKEILNKKQETLRILRLHCQEKESEAQRKHNMLQEYKDRISALNSQIEEEKNKQRQLRLEFEEQLEDLMSQHKDLWEFHRPERLAREICTLDSNKEQLLKEEKLVEAKLEDVKHRLCSLFGAEGPSTVTEGLFLRSQEAAAAVQLFEEENRKAEELLATAAQHHRQLQQKCQQLQQKRQRLKEELENYGVQVPAQVHSMQEEGIGLGEVASPKPLGVHEEKDQEPSTVQGLMPA
ncbi:2-oxoglutarate and iron-dependent oxygenase JMJD4 isoform X3 [Tupaia chinensis]|nr:2-oxoglutarate and iron-dependent oxygenase JMJD4 isoform X3 [Tupaia chinensis]